MSRVCLRILNAMSRVCLKSDFQAIVDCTAEDFERAFAYESHGGAKTLLEVFSASKVKETFANVHAALKHVLVQTATVPLTEGYPMCLRHQSFSQSLCFGALK